MTTPREIAEWMLEKIKGVKYLYQEEIVYEIAATFGNEFTYINQNGNLAIDKRVLSEFRKLTESFVVWERGEKLWRFREDYDHLGRRQAD
jgi:hypothetical protein